MLEGLEYARHMISSDQTTKKRRDLCLEVRRHSNLWGAWQAVRQRALASRDTETIRDAREIDQNPAKHIRDLHEALRYGHFEFAKQRGILKYKKGKKTPRPIVVSPVHNRIVQRAILNVLQSDKKSVVKKLGDMPRVLATPTSVGGIPGRGSPEAVDLIRGAIGNGATHFVRSDIKNFFSNISVPCVLDFLRSQTNDEALTCLVQKALAVELSNDHEAKVKEWISLFPTGGIGVPQGSSLSALCGNVILRDFDARFNERGIIMVRYIDDFVMLGRSERSLQRTWASAETHLRKLGFEAHSPFPASPKASSGRISEGFDFLSFRFHCNKISPSRAAKKKLIADIDNELREFRRAVKISVKSPRRAAPGVAQVLSSIDRRIRGWGDAFKEVDQRLEFTQLDDDIRRRIGLFLSRFFGTPINVESASSMRALGIALLADTPKCNSGPDI